MKRLLVLIAMLMVLGACTTDTSGTGLEILSAPAFEPDCSLSPTAAAYYPSGSYDPAYPVYAPAYALPLLLRNNLESNERDNPATGFEDVPLNRETNNIQVSGYETCWYRGDDPRVTPIDAFQDGELIPCSSLPADQRAFVGATALVEADLGESATSVLMLRPQALRAGGMFGPNFDAQSIPYYIPGFWLEDPADPARDTSSWGTYPTDTRHFRVYVQVRAVGTLQSGRAIHSNWFVFPVDLCVGCQIGVCGIPVSMACDDAGTIFAAQGEIVDRVTSCLVSQNVNVVCTGYSECP